MSICIFGGTHGIGARLAKDLSVDRKISVCGRTIRPLLGEDYLSDRCNVEDIGSIKDFVLKTVFKFNIIDTVIFCCGEMEYNSFEKAGRYELYRMADSMMVGYMNVVNAVVPVMRSQGHGKIIQLSSTRAITAAPGKALYSAVKRGQKSLSDSVNIEYGKYNIQAVALCVGAVDTESTRKMYTKKELKNIRLVPESDVVAAVKFIIGLSDNSRIHSLVMGGMF